MHDFFASLVQILSANKQFFFENGIFLRNNLFEYPIRMAAGLLGLLRGNEDTKNLFFINVVKILVFDKVGFGWSINNREFLPDSYTRFKKLLGLTAGRGDRIFTSDEMSYDGVFYCINLMR